MDIYDSTWLEASGPTRGLVKRQGWGNFKIDEKGAAMLMRKELPDDLTQVLSKVVASASTVYKRAKDTFQAMAEVRVCG